MLCKIPKAIKVDIKPEPPQLTKGSETPIMGSNPRFMPILIKIWEIKIVARPEEKSLGKLLSQDKAILIIRQINKEKSESKTITPMNPNSSEMAEKIKSVWGSGKNPY